MWLICWFCFNLIGIRYGKSISRYERIPFYDYSPRCYRNDRLPRPSPNVYSNNSILLSVEFLLGIQTACLVPSDDSAIDNRRVRAWLVCCRTREKLDKPASRHRVGNLCYGYIPSLLGLAGPQNRKQAEAISCSNEANRMSMVKFPQDHGLTSSSRYIDGLAVLSLS